jgi:hypothetical protein
MRGLVAGWLRAVSTLANDTPAKDRRKAVKYRQAEVFRISPWRVAGKKLAAYGAPGLV